MNLFNKKTEEKLNELLERAYNAEKVCTELAENVSDFRIKQLFAVKSGDYST